MDWNQEAIKGLLEIIGHSMKSRRLSQEISQQELSKLSGVSSASIARFETGKGNISLQNLLLLTRALGMANDLKAVFRERESAPSLIAKASSKKSRERVRKSRKDLLELQSEWKWGDGNE